MLLDTQAVKTILLEIPSLGRQNVASILIFSQSFGGTLHLTAQAYQLLLHLSSYFSDWETKGEKMKKMGLGVPALPFTFVAHLLAVAAIVMVLL
ncbi:uncharacterized protein DS421_19g652000 [Arachis hypogaea]|uniref:Uncharacterized protein n=1 Tax=Arachis hypogaea TaxID=3818 RepID=A0A6B9V7G4_ARAHY|nr:uncharacterized protein DS421_19g652000 [Arachis hypogaea]